MSKLKAARRNALPEGAFAFPSERKLPLEDAAHVRNAIARFDQVEGVSDHTCDAAWKRVKAAAERHGINIHESSWCVLGRSAR